MISFLLLSGQIFAQLLSENFDGVATPALPSGWTTGVNIFGDPWETSSSNSNSAPNNASLIITGSGVGEGWLATTSFSTIGSSDVTVTWQARTSLGSDPTVVQYRVGSGGSWTSVSFTGTATSTYSQQSVVLPAAVNENSEVYVRWSISVFSSGAEFNIDDVVITASASSPVTYYSKNGSKGALHLLSSWSDTQDETGSSPPDFTSGNFSFIIDDSGCSFTSDWPSSGTVQDLTLAIGASLTIPSTAVLNGTVSLASGSELILQNTTLPTFSTIHRVSTITYAQGGSASIAAYNYGILKVANNGVYSINGSLTVRGGVVLESGELVLSTSVFDNFNLEANITRTSGSITGSSNSNMILTGGGNVNALYFTSGSEFLRKLVINKTAGTITNLLTDLTITSVGDFRRGTLFVGSNTLVLSNTVSVSAGYISSNTGGTVSYNRQSNSQVIVPGTYGNLTFSNFTKTLPSGQTVEVAGTFTAGSATGHTVTGNTFVFSGTGQSIPQFNFNNLTISTGASTTSTSDFSVAGNYTINGTFNASAGTISFDGSVDQTVGGTSLGSFNNITVSNTAGVSVTGSVDLNGVLSLSGGGVFDADGSGSGIFTVKSNSVTSDARIATLATPANFTGNVTVERFVNGVAGGDWRYLSVPTTGANLGMWRDDFPITGNFSDASPVGSDNVLNSSAPSVYLYNADTDAYEALTAGGASTSTVSLNNGIGYSIYTYQDADEVVDVSGPIGKGNIGLSISTTSGRFNLLGNPYPSALDGDAALDANGAGSPGSGVESTLYIRTSNNVFASYNASIDAGAGHPNGGWAGEVAQGQAFWVVSDGGSSLSVTEDMKIGLGNGQLLRAGEDYSTSLLKVRLSGGDQSDETVIGFKETAVDGIDGFDGKKLLNGYFNNSIKMRTHMNLSSYNTDNSMRYVFNVVDNQSCNRTVKLRIEDVAAGNYQLSFSEWDKFDLPYQVTLIDNYPTRQEIPVTSTTFYSFDVTSDAASKGADRFELAFIMQEIDENIDYQPQTQGSCQGYTTVRLQNTQQGFVYTLINESGTAISNDIVSDGGIAELFVDNNALGQDPNILSLKVSVQNNCSADFIAQDAVVVDLSEMYEISEVVGDEVCGSTDKAILTASGAGADGYYRWYESIDTTEPILGESSAELVVENITSTTSYYVSAVNADGCESSRVEVTAEFIDAQTPDEDIDYTPEVDISCVDGNTDVILNNTQEGFLYSLISGDGAVISGEIAGGGAISFNISNDKLISGTNLLSVHIYVPDQEVCTNEFVVQDVVAIDFSKVYQVTSVEGDKVCGSSGSAVLTATGAEGDAFYRWYSSVDAIDYITGETGNQLILTDVINSDSYYVSIVNPNGCEGERVEVPVEFVDIVKPEIEIDGLILKAPEADTYQWYKDGVAIPEAVSKEYEIESSGSYEVEISINDCLRKSDAKQFVITGNDDDQVIGDIRVFPNPVNDRLNVSIGKTGSVSFHLFDSKGNLLMDNEKFIINNKNNYFLDVSDLREGMYILNIERDNNTVVSIMVLKK